jgi:hypothetical protein
MPATYPAAGPETPRACDGGFDDAGARRYMHAPSTQLMPGTQVVVQEPQCWGLLLVLRHVPEQ